jgi:YHYH protein/FG-GAP-like repeat
MKKTILFSLLAVSIGITGLMICGNVKSQSDEKTQDDKGSPTDLIGQVSQNAAVASSLPPVISKWMINRNAATGFDGILVNVQQVRYSNNNVYVSATDIPSYRIGPWANNPNTARNQNYTVKIPRYPVAQGGQKTSTPLGPVGIFLNGVAVFNTLDGMSFNNQNIWHQNAVIAEASSFDACSGHPAPTGDYHHHQNPNCLYTINPAQHSPLLGYAFDGFPIYGAYGYSNTNGPGGIKRMRSSYRYRNISQRTSLPNGTGLQPSQYGPPVSTANPLGKYNEDFEYVPNLGDLDEHNGRFAVTPDYPSGTYAYYVTIYEDGTNAFPYYMGFKYYGVAATENITQQARVRINEPTTAIVPTVNADFDGDGKTDYSIYRSSNNYWYQSDSSNSAFHQYYFGAGNDRPLSADFDGDRRTDVAVFRPNTGEWFVFNSKNNTLRAQPFGALGDIPLPADFDGDGQADITVFRPTTGQWIILQSTTNNYISLPFGIGSDKPVVGDFDGDGRADVTVFRPSNGTWYSSRSSDGVFTAVQWGLGSDRIVPSDYDGDGKTDYAVFRPQNGGWYALNSSNYQTTGVNWGYEYDLPLITDFDGDGKTDFTVFRPSEGSWYTLLNASRYTYGGTYGIAGDIPIPGVNPQ